MLTDPNLRSKVDSLWDMLWTGGLNNPMDAIEQLSYLLFLKRLDDEENRKERRATRRGQIYEPSIPEEMRWRSWTNLTADEALKQVKEEVFPWLRKMGGKGSSFAEYMDTAEFKINRASLLIEACEAIDQMQISAQNQDVQGDLYEYLLSHLSTAGRAGQFRTPRHIIRMMVGMIDPKPGEQIGDMAAGTCGFLTNAYEYILEQYTSSDVIEYDEEGQPHNLIGNLLTDDQRQFLQEQAFRGYDNDSGMTMLRIGSMNLMYHGIEHPRFFYMDTLSDAFDETADYDVILMNPPFKGKVDKDHIAESLPDNTTKSELLFVHLILRALDSGGRCAVIVPDGVLFGSSRAHKALRQKLVEENRLDGVVSMPGGVFKPYAGVSTAVLLFTKGASTDQIWFYDMAHDGFSLDDKRQPTTENDIPNILDCWRNRNNTDFQAERLEQLEVLESEVAPLKAERLRLQGEINRLTFESVIAANGDEPIHAELEATKTELADLESQIAPLHKQINQLHRQFWVSKEQVKAQSYDLTASRYRQVTSDETYYEQPIVTLDRLLILETKLGDQVRELEALLE